MDNLNYEQLAQLNFQEKVELINKKKYLEHFVQDEDDAIALMAIRSLFSTLHLVNYLGSPKLKKRVMEESADLLKATMGSLFDQEIIGND